MTYHINGQDNYSEALPGKTAVQRVMHPHYYALPCGDVYFVTACGDIAFIDRDSESPTTVWCSAEQGLYPCYYKPVTNHIGSGEISSGSTGSFVPIYCVETWKQSHPLSCPSAISEDCVVFMMNTYDRLTQGSNRCMVIRRGNIIYNGCCDFRGLPYVNTRGASMMGNYYQAHGEQEYQWAKDENGKYLGAGVDQSKTWEWVNLFSSNVSNPPLNDEWCAEYAVNDFAPQTGIFMEYRTGCLDCGEGDTCDTSDLTQDHGEFASHTIDNIWFNYYDQIREIEAMGAEVSVTKDG